MTLRYILHETKKNRLMTLFILLQMGILFWVMIFIISAVQSRSRYYMPFRQWLHGSGIAISGLWGMNGRDGDTRAPMCTSQDLENQLRQAEVDGLYDVEIYMDGITRWNGDSDFRYSTKTIGYDDALLECYSPDMSSGRWLKAEDKNTQEIEVVLAPKEQTTDYQIGEKLKLYTWDEDGQPKESDCSARIVGIMEEGSKYIGVKQELPEANKAYFEDFYATYYQSQTTDTIAFVSREDMQKEGMWDITLNDLCFISYEENISKTSIAQNEKFLDKNCTALLRQNIEVVEKNSKSYIYRQMDIFVPVLMGLFILTFMSLISNTAIGLKQNMREYAIYYMHGLTWKQCISLYRRNMLIGEGITLLVVLCMIRISLWKGYLSYVILSLGVVQIGTCLGLIAIFSMVSVVVDKILIGRSSAKDILREAMW